MLVMLVSFGKLEGKALSLLKVPVRQGQQGQQRALTHGRSVRTGGELTAPEHTLTQGTGSAFLTLLGRGRTA